MIWRSVPMGVWLVAAVMCVFATYLATETPAVASTEQAETSDRAHDGDAEAHGHEGVVPHGTNEDPAEWQYDLAIWTFVVFVLVLLILWKFAWGPIVAGLDKREQRIADLIQHAEDNAEASRKQLAQHEKQLAGAHEEIRQMLDTAHREADAQKQEVLAQAQEAAAAEKNRALREIGAAKDAALGEIAKKSVDEAFSLAGKIVRREVKPEEHQQLVQDAMQQFPSTN